MGAKVRGAGTDVIRIEGVENYMAVVTRLFQIELKLGLI